MMKATGLLVLQAVLLSVAVSAQAKPTEYAPPVLEQFTNPDCETTQTCSLKNFSVETTEYRVTFADDTYALGKSMTARYRTDSKAHLRDYAVVQFIRGCVFSTELKNGVVQKSITTSREHFGRNIIFKHPAWVVDTSTTDPIYWSVPEEKRDRHFFYLWNRKKGSVDERSAVLFGQRQPPTPELYITDDPTGASLLSLTDLSSPVSNVTLEFSTCLYRTQDVPRTLAPDQLPTVDAIHCVNWKFSRVYDYATRKFESPEGIDPFCQ